jgi:hypothetical protein
VLEIQRSIDIMSMEGELVAHYMCIFARVQARQVYALRKGGASCIFLIEMSDRNKITLYDQL